MHNLEIKQKKNTLKTVYYALNLEFCTMNVNEMIFTYLLPIIHFWKFDLCLLKVDNIIIYWYGFMANESKFDTIAKKINLSKYSIKIWNPYFL